MPKKRKVRSFKSKSTGGSKAKAMANRVTGTYLRSNRPNPGTPSKTTYSNRG